MKRWLLLSLLCFVSLESYEDYWCLSNALDIEGQYAILRRSEIRDLPLVKDTADLPIIDFPDLPPIDLDFLAEELKEAKTVLNTDDLVSRMKWKSLVGGSLMYSGNGCGSLEARYAFIYPWKSGKNVRGDGTLRFPFDDPMFAFDYIEADEVQADYESWLQNGEFNYWLHVTPRRCNYFSFSWLGGFRFMYLKEDFSLAFTKRENTSDYAIETKNYLYGLQLGAVLEVKPSNCFSWLVQVKGAGFFNDGCNKVFLGDENNTVALRDYTKEKWSASWLIEGYAQLAFHWTSFLSTYFGYGGFLLSGLILAPEQVDQQTTTTKRFIRNEGKIVIDGIRAGLTLSF